MIKNLLLFLALITVSIAYSQNIDFENWTTNSIKNLEYYETMINDNSNYGSLSVIRSTDSYSSEYSLLLKTVLTSNGDTIFGYFADGDPESQEGGQALTTLTAVDSVIGYYKYEVMPNDTALFLCMTKKSGIVSGGGMFTLTGSQPTWKRFSYAINALAADTIMVAAASSNAINGIGVTPGSYLMLDSIFIKHNIQGIEYIKNHSFENWTDTYWDDLDEWTTYNKFFIGEGNLPVEKITDAQSNTYACKISTKIYYEDTIQGSITYGEWIDGTPVGGIELSITPDKVSFYYKSNLSNLDTAYVNFLFKKDGAIIGGNNAVITENKADYTFWEQTVVLGQTPDTLFIYVNSGKKVGSEFIIDNIVISPITDIEIINKKQIVAYPTPAKDKINFILPYENIKNIDVKIYNTLGKLVVSEKFDNKKDISIDISKLKKGNYIYRINVNDVIYSKSFIKN